MDGVTDKPWLAVLFHFTNKKIRLPGYIYAGHDVDSQIDCRVFGFEGLQFERRDFLEQCLKRIRRLLPGLFHWKLQFQHVLKIAYLVKVCRRFSVFKAISTVGETISLGETACIAP
jgi:hypothetical protein